MTVMNESTLHKIKEKVGKRDLQPLQVSLPAVFWAQFKAVPDLLRSTALSHAHNTKDAPYTIGEILGLYWVILG